MALTPRPLPNNVQELCETLQVPPRLLAHLILVHDTAVEIVEALQKDFSALRFDKVPVLFGAASHDLGKILHPTELTGPGNLHENAGVRLLQQHDISPEYARFAQTHGAWNNSNLAIEDLLVALADKVWRGKREQVLEALIVTKIVEQTGQEHWEVFDKLDNLATEIASVGNERLAWQQSH